MLKSAAINHFRTQAALAANLEISQAAVSKWDEIVPEGQAYKLQAITHGALKVDPELYKKPNPKPDTPASNEAA